VNLVVDKMRQLEHVDVADRYRLIELVSGHTVEEVDLAGVRQARNSSKWRISASRAPSIPAWRTECPRGSLPDFQQIVVAQLR